MNIYKSEVLSFIDSLGSLVELNSEYAQSAEDAVDRAYYRGKVGAYGLCIKWIKEGFFDAKESR